MTISDIKEKLNILKNIQFKLPDGNLVPEHFHVTEIGKITKHFIDCGGVERKEEVVNFQLWNADDYDHRLHPEKLLRIIEMAEQKLNITNSEIEVEYQGETIQKFELEFEGENFLLVNKQTDCLAKEQCGIPSLNEKFSAIVPQGESCTPGSGCC